MENLILTSDEKICAYFNDAVTQIKNYIDSLTLSNQELIPSKEVMKRISISPNTLQKMRDNGEIPFIKRNGKILYDINDVVTALKKGKNA